MIQNRIKDFRVKIKKELDLYSLSTKADWLNALKSNACTAKHIREMYLIWLHLITEEMEKNPRFECANTMEGFMSLNCHNVDINEIYKMVCDCFICDGLFKNSRYRYEDAAATIVIANPKLGMRNANESLHDRGELMGFPWNFLYDSWSLRDIAGMIKLLCEQYFKTNRPRKTKYELLAKMKNYLNSVNAVVALPNSPNPITHKVWLDNHYSASASRQYNDWLDVVKHPELVPLLNKHGIHPNIYSCTNLVQLTNMFEELVDNLTTEARQANKHSNMVSAVRCYIEHLLEINGVLI